MAGTPKTDLRHELERDRRTASRDYGGSVMSNSKWRVIFEALSTAELEIQQITAKFIGVQEEKRMQLPWLKWTPRPYIDSIEFGPFPIVGIEWIDIPAEAEIPTSHGVRRHRQDLSLVASTLAATGRKLMHEERPDALRIIGHLPKN